MKAAQLRQAISQAAVQGKLVPQNTHDEPADKLLERIRAEKARLIKEGKIKKDKLLSPITEDDTPYDLPDGWIWCRLGEIVLYSGGFAFKSTDYVKESNNQVIRLGNVKNDKLVLKTAPVYISERIAQENLKNKIFTGDILFTMTGTRGKRDYFYTHLVKESDLNEKTLYLNQRVGCLRAIDKKVLRILCIFLKSEIVFEQVFYTETGTANQGNIGSTDTLNILFPLPPLAEQQRIVAKVDELMALCDELEAAEKELDKLEADFTDYLPKSILQAAVQGKLVPQNIHDEPAGKLLGRIRAEKARLVKEGKIKKEKPLPPIAEDDVPYDLPEGWVWCRLSDIGEIVGGATPLTSETSFYIEAGKGIAWITPADIKNTKNNFISRGNKDITEDGYNSCSTKMLPSGSVVFSSRAPIGLLAFAQNELCTNQGFKSVVPYDLSMNKWIYYGLMYMTENIIGRASGTTFLEVSGEFMRKELLPLPPLAEQQRIVAKVDELMALCDELKTARDTSIAPTIPKITPFPAQEADDVEEIGIAARGDIQGLSDEALRDIDELFGDEDND